MRASIILLALLSTASVAKELYVIPDGVEMRYVRGGPHPGLVRPGTLPTTQPNPTKAP